MSVGVQYLYMKKFLILLLSCFALAFLVFFGYRFIERNSLLSKEILQSQEEKKEASEVDNFLKQRQSVEIKDGLAQDLFHSDGTLRVLLVGLDKRVGQTKGHCDVIQMLTFDKNKGTVNITALPRGTYAPLPPGVAASSTDYYVSNSCGLVSLEYGVKQIEKILGQKADFLVVVGFSETLGILRSLNLPTTETLQWLRQRQGYAIGEPQRAHNHSTFIKSLLTKYIPKEKSQLDIPFKYLMYKTVQTDLSFEQALALEDALRSLQLDTHPEKVTLSMRPAYLVADIVYDPQHLTVRPGADTLESIQKKLFDSIDAQKEKKEFVIWAFENDLWLQVEDAQKREALHFEFLKKYIQTLETKEKRQEVLADYILEMQHREQGEWIEKGKTLLKNELLSL